MPASIAPAESAAFLDSRVHSLDLPVGPWMFNFGRPVINAIFAAGAAKYEQASDAVLFTVGELDAVVGKNRMNGVRKCLDEIGQES